MRLDEGSRRGVSSVIVVVLEPSEGVSTDGPAWLSIEFIML
jgi:hypothetical protein